MVDGFAGCRRDNEGAMKLHYDRETDSLYIDLNAGPSVDSREVQDGVVIDLDEKGPIVGIDIARLLFPSLGLSQLPSLLGRRSRQLHLVSHLNY